MNSFALFRLPHQQRFTFVGQTDGEPRRLCSCAELGCDAGFVVAPFMVSADCPLLLIRPDFVNSFDVSETERCRPYIGSVRFVHRRCTFRTSVLYENQRDAYKTDFVKFYDELAARRLRKVVLSRCAEEPFSEDVDLLQLFQKACTLYPRLFVALVSTPQSGTWLVATPEVLLEGEGTQWRTIALAGTMRLEGDELAGEGEQARWSVKNIEEQRLVASYLTEQLMPFADGLTEEGPRTVRAANLVHLRSDFTFTLLNNARVGDLLARLHPTPAVCGLPKAEALSFITANEHSPRRYYSGFMGPVALGGATRLYVSLRCMQITPGVYRLYAGGGLLRESQEELEWQETEAKLETMRRLVSNKSHGSVRKADCSSDYITPLLRKEGQWVVENTSRRPVR